MERNTIILIALIFGLVLIWFFQEDRWFPSSKKCNCCGYINQNLKLSDRFWTCPKCNTKLDRDLNSSKNILEEGIKEIQSAGTVDNRHGDQIRPAKAGTIGEVSKIQENNFLEARELNS